jgi:hypothetical protein
VYESFSLEVAIPSLEILESVSSMRFLDSVIVTYEKAPSVKRGLVTSSTTFREGCAR